jgi:hypothetical protein
MWKAKSLPFEWGTLGPMKVEVTGTNTLAYYIKELITAVKKFYSTGFTH